MNLTLDELAQKLASYYDEVSLLELLNINSFDLVERFSDVIEEKYDTLIKEFEEEEADD
jgi:hypothetical protein